MGSLDGRVAFITGAARGQGRSHAVRLAAEGASIVALDICAQIESIPYRMPGVADLDETVDMIRRQGGRVLGVVCDVRDPAALANAVSATYQEFGRLDIVLANAGISGLARKCLPNAWQDTLDVNLTGVLNTLQACTPRMVESGNGGAIVITSSAWGLLAPPTDDPAALAYVAAKHGLTGLMRAYANLLAPESIRVNTLHPSGVRTPMIWDFEAGTMNDYLGGFYEDVVPTDTRRNSMPVDLLETSDVSDAVAWLVSDAAKYVTGISLPVCAGFLLN